MPENGVSMIKRGALFNALVRCALCLMGALSINMARTMGEELPALYGLEPGGEVILLMPCVGWLLFSSLPVAYYAAWTHMSVSRLGYMELMRYRRYHNWRLRNYGSAALFCAVYALMAFASQLILDGRYIADAHMLMSAAASTGLILVSLLMQCAVFQWAYLNTEHGETALLAIILQNAVGAALGYVAPRAALFIPASWAMYARSSAYVDGGYPILAALAVELAVMIAALMCGRSPKVSVFSPQNKAK